MSRIASAFSEWAAEAALGHLSARHVDAEASISLDAVTLLAPLNPGARIFATGRNYADHLLRLGASIPASPSAFIMPDSAIIGDAADIAYPPTTNELDYEIELVAVMAKPLMAGASATSSVLGYTIGNDVSARDAMRIAGGRSDLFSQKACDGATPVGPWIATLDEFGGPGQPEVALRLSVNGEERQSDNTKSMLFSVDRCLDYVDDRIALRAGDLVFTGTTHGVGMESGRFLQPGDVVEAQIDKIGALRNRVGNKMRSRRFTA